jgi:uncharacterized protein YfaS (alpha-2-macroglobulin family)
LSVQIANLPGSTIRFTNTLTDFDQKKLFDPDSQEINFFDPAGTLKATLTEADTTRISLGVFRLYYTIPDDAMAGYWRLEWKAVSGDLPSKHRVTFEVAA